MPIVEAHVLEGYGVAEKSRLTRALTDAVSVVIPPSDDPTTVLIREHSHLEYTRDGAPLTLVPALKDPVELVSAYLRAMEARDLERARSFLAPDFEMTFPGPTHMTNLTALIEWAQDRYRSVTKTIEGTEALHANDVTVVFVRGTLEGQWTDETPFSGIRFIDRFELRGNKICKQDVWNDIAEVRNR